MIKDKKQYIETLGVQLEKMGRTPMEGRVFATLLIANPPETSFDELVEFLQASKSAVSNALKKLQMEGSVKYITKSGDRKRYFIVDTANWQNQLKDSAKNFSAFNQFLLEINDYRSSLNSEAFNAELKKILDFQLFISMRFEEAIAEWNNK